MFRIALSLLIIALPLEAQDYSTTNGHKLTRFTESFARRPGPVRVLSIGDSMADSYRSLTLNLVNRFLEKRPYAGSSLNNAYNKVLWNSTNGATVVPPSALWLSYQFKVPQGSSVWWEHQFHPFGITSDRLGIYWVAQQEGGSFHLLISERGGEWKTKLILDGFSPKPVGRSAFLDLPTSEYRLLAASSTGTNYIIGPELVNTAAKGLHVAWLDYSGLSISQVLQVPAAVREPIFRAFGADLLIWHFKEIPTGLGAALEENEMIYQTAAPQMDVLYIGTPWFAFDGGGAQTIEQNVIVRAAALRHGRGYLDCMTSAPDHEWLLQHGYMDDNIHPNYAGSEFLAEKGWLDIGFFSLGADRRLTFSKGVRSMFLEATLATGISYEFQSSTDLIHWSTFETRTGPAEPARIPVGTDDSGKHYRMRLKPQQ